MLLFSDPTVHAFYEKAWNNLLFTGGFALFFILLAMLSLARMMYIASKARLKQQQEFFKAFLEGKKEFFKDFLEKEKEILKDFLEKEKADVQLQLKLMRTEFKKGMEEIEETKEKK